LQTWAQDGDEVKAADAPLRADAREPAF
jgi:hypothetical protein